MIDGIIKGTGNSRYLKSVPNIQTLYPTYDDLIDALAAGTFPIDLNGINPTGWETTGNKLDKSTLLTDTLCTNLGISTSSTPTQAMDKLRTLINTAQTTANGKGFVSSGSYTGTGRYGVNDKTKLTFAFSPKFVFIVGMSYNYFGFILQRMGYGIAASDFGTYCSPLIVNVSGNTVSWYNTTSGSYQLNETYEYIYTAIG